MSLASPLVAAAPIPPASAPPRPKPTTGARRSEAAPCPALAVLLCSVLAEHAPCMRCVTDEDTNERLHTIVARELMRRSIGEVLAWRSRVPGQEWCTRWDTARRLAAEFWPRLPGVQALPGIDIDRLDEAARTEWLVQTIPAQPS